MLRNADLESFFNQNKGKICSISLNNGKNLLIDYPGVGNVSSDDISFVKIGSCDMMKIKHTNYSYGKEMKFTSYITTEFIEGINVMDDGYEQFRLDPLTL